MCGIVGCARFHQYGLSYKEQDVFADLLVVGALRGTDGTGVFIVDSEKEVRTLKIGGVPHQLMRDPAYAPFLEKHKKNFKATEPQDRFIVGHNRAKTVGEGTTANAHPHVAGDITLVHNGTLRNYSTLPDMKDFDVDSHALANAIDKLGIDEAIGRTHGAYAIVYYNKKDATLNFLRNSERPLAMAYDKQQDRIYFASEERMLAWVLGRNYVDLSKDVIMANLKTDTLLTFSMDNIEPEVRTVKGPPIASYHRHMGYFESLEADVMGDSYSSGGGTFGEWVQDAAGIYVQLPSPKNLRKEEKKIEKVLNKIKKLGVDVTVLQELNGLKRGDQLVFDVRDYADESDSQERFLVMGDSKSLKDTAIRFKLSGMKSLDDVFNHGKCIGTIRNILEYPEAAQGEDQYVIWVNDPQLYFPKETYPLLSYDPQGNPLH